MSYRGTYAYKGHEDKPTELPHNCTPCDSDGWTGVKGAGRWFMVSELSDGDDLLYKSNRRVFEDTYSEGEGSWWKYARHGSIVIRTLAYRNYSDLRDTIDSLSDYPLIDDSDHSDLECEEEREQWESDGRDDTRREMRDYINARFEERGITHDKSGKDADEIVEAITDDQIDALYSSLCQSTNWNGGGTVLFEDGNAVFSDEVIWGTNGARWKGIDRNAWDGLIPVIKEDGKIDYDHTNYENGGIGSWVAALDLDPWCPRCHKIHVSDRSDTNVLSDVWECPCTDPGCDVPILSHGDETTLPGVDIAPPVNRELAELASYLLRSWDVGMMHDTSREYSFNEESRKRPWEKISKLCEAQGDMRSAVALRMRNPDECDRLMLANKCRNVVRGVLRGIIKGELPRPSAVEPAYMQGKPVCCIVSGDYCCEHGKSAVECCMCQTSDSKAECPVHGTRENKRKRGEPTT